MLFSSEFIRGFAFSLDLLGSRKTVSDFDHPEEKDLKALSEDWINVGKSIKEATNKYACSQAD